MAEKSDRPDDEVKMNEIEEKVNFLEDKLLELGRILKLNMEETSEQRTRILLLIEMLEQRTINAERTIDRFNNRLEGVAMHPEDEGWFQ